MLYEATKSQLNRQYEISTRGQKVGYNKKDTVDTVNVNITNMQHNTEHTAADRKHIMSLCIKMHCTNSININLILTGDCIIIDPLM